MSAEKSRSGVFPFVMGYTKFMKITSDIDCSRWRGKNRPHLV
jgi:hypothetical protein